ncbi:hypothetical protein SAMN06295924_109112 [Rathayibacter rathayi NCPPB 2980 = VKM Ac-1601]|uniref:hypothetical protein n=1 Tax=Rathayibacter rathayi TaxID=33887 RepID=UPI000BCC9BFA|nr:hypothetical protein [Rathayibacter rathayi]AZZ49676.1 hypothetical protein C1O28_11190 [Rathayibacter rathayi]MWV75342.1 hypothetical protein [Rathayibacter rathayi NCPPB 2980 = VKM Ac-1601]PPF47919.1 hypothetical protein C5C08_10270 [Rathayibacter rathayi]PPG67827.1 hypothetical protein C5C16_08695 [Rathayibacter rathayi]PPG79481.1 hypothetical protein C5C15_06230 [Rathayibacter rathayi]
MEIFVGLVGLLGGLVIAGLAVVAVVIGRRRAVPASLVDVEVRLTHAGDGWWRVGARVRNSGRSLVPVTSYSDGRPIVVDLGGAVSAEWYGSAPRSDAWRIDTAVGLLLGPVALERDADLGATIVVRGRPQVRINAPLRSVPVRENVIESQMPEAAPVWGAAETRAAVAPAPHRPIRPRRRRPSDTDRAQAERESVLRGGFGVWAAMIAGGAGAACVAVGIALELAGVGASGLSGAGIILIAAGFLGLVGTLVVRLLRRWLEPSALWRTPSQRLRRPGTITLLTLSYAGLALFCVEFAAQSVTGDTTWVASVAVLMLIAALIGTGLVGFLRLVVLLGVRRASREAP